MSITFRIPTVVLFFIFLLTSTSISLACDDSLGSPWYNLTYQIDTQKLPPDIQVSYQPNPTLTTTNTQSYQLLKPDTFNYSIPDYPHGYFPGYRFSSQQTQRFNTYTRQWEDTNQVTIHSDSLSSEIPYRLSNGFGRTNQIPVTFTTSFNLLKQGQVITVPVNITYNLNPNYDPYYGNRPYVFCGSPLVTNKFLSPFVYFITMSLFLTQFQTASAVIKYDLSLHYLDAYLFVTAWTVILSIITYIIITKLFKSPPKSLKPK